MRWRDGLLLTPMALVGLMLAPLALGFPLVFEWPVLATSAGSLALYFLLETLAPRRSAAGPDARKASPSAPRRDRP